MFKNHLMTAAAAVAALTIALGAAGCKKKEEPKAAPPATAEAGKAAAETAMAGEAAKAAEHAPAAVVAAPAPQPDVDIAAGNGVAAWLSIKSFNGLFDAVDVIGGKFGLIPPSTNLRATTIAGVTQGLGGAGVKDIEWIDKARPIHIGYQDETPAAGEAPDSKKLAGGAFVLLPITDEKAALAAMPTALKDAAADGHAAAITPEPGAADKVYIDFIGGYAVLTVLDKGRYAKIKPFAERLAKVDPPATLYLGVSVEDLVKTRAAEIDKLVKMMETGAAESAAADPAKAAVKAKMIGMYSKMVQTWITDMTRVELLVNADINAARIEFRMAARDGSKLARQLGAGRGRTTAVTANLLPANSYFTVSANNDPAATAEQLDESMAMVKEMLKLEPAAWDALLKDMKDLVKLNTGEAAMGVYADGASAVGLLIVGGTTDGETAVRVGKRVFGQLALALLAMARAESLTKGKTESPEDAELFATFEKVFKDGSVQPLIDKYGEKLKGKGVTATAGSSKEGEIACDTLDIALDYAASKDKASAEEVKKVLGDKLALVACASKAKISFAFGPGALEKARAAASGKVGGLADAPAYKAAATGDKDGSTVMYINPGTAIAAFKDLVPPSVTLPGDKAVTLTCINRTQSYGCGVEVPIDLMVAIKSAVDAAKGGGRPDPAGAPGPLAVPPPPPGKVK